MKPDPIEPILKLLRQHDQDSKDLAHHLWAAGELQKVIVNGGLDAAALSHLRYQIGICLDLAGRPLDAFEYFDQALRSEPYNQEYRHSMAVIQGRISAQASELYSENDENPVLLRYHEILNAHQYSPFWLAYAVARILAKTGKRAEAKSLAMSVHELCPNDPDSLRETLRVARLSGDRAWEHVIIDQIEEIRERRPHDRRYADLV